MLLYTDIQDVGDRLAGSISKEIETRIREKLMAEATIIVNEVARDLARDVLRKINEVHVQQNASSLSATVILNVGKEPPETFTMKSEVVSSRDPK